jgi:anti-anti-sigma regulatory factor
MEIEFNELGEHKIISVSGEVDLYNVSELKKALFSITDGKLATLDRFFKIYENEEELI